MPSHWTPSISVGLKELDDQHRELFSWLAMLDQALHNRDRMEIGRVLDFLSYYVVAHFDAEEVLMKETAYPNHRRHKLVHDRFVGEFLELKSNYETDKSVSSARSRSHGWTHALKAHIAVEDETVARHIEQERLGRDPRLAVAQETAAPRTPASTPGVELR